MREGQVAAPGILRHSPRDALLVSLAAGYGALLIAAPNAIIIAIGVWWIANTVAHNFIHLPFFRSRASNAAFSLYLSALLGLPQTLWRDRHLAHHAGRAWHLRWTPQLGAELTVVLAMWLAIARSSTALLVTCVAGWLGGLALCALHGYFEHARGTVSHYGALYNAAFFNDGFHVEHHARPGLHWTQLPRAFVRDTAPSPWPAVLRWLEVSPLNALERIALRSGAVQRFMVDRHARAFARLIGALPLVRSATIVGGGLFPRTALVLQRVAPQAGLTIIDRSSESIARARPHLRGPVRIVEASYSAALCRSADLVVVPLAFVGDREEFYARPPAPAVLIHEWIWRRRGEGTVVSYLLLKRVNLVRR